MKKIVLILGMALALVIFNAPAKTQGQDSTLVGSWNFNECSGDTTHDISTYQNHGTRTGAEWINLGGGNCGLYFDTTYEYVRVLNSPSISDLSQITIEAMIIVDSLPDDSYSHVIMFKEYGYGIYLESEDSCLWGGVWDPGAPGTWIVLASASKIPIGIPVYVAFTASKVTKEMKIYINGELDTTKVDELLPNWVDDHNDLFLGVDYAYGIDWFAQFYGKIDWIRLWNKVIDIHPLKFDSLFVGSDTVCLDPRLHKVQLVLENLDTLKAMAIPLLPEITCPNFTIDSISFAGTRIENWEEKVAEIGPDSIVLGLVANLGGGTPPLLPGEGSIAYIYYTIDCDTTHTGETCYFALDTTTIQPESQHLLFVDNHNYEFVPYFEPGTTTVSLYRPGDINCNCEVNIGDVVGIINYLFRNGPEPCPIDAGDVNGNCNVDVGDAVYLINYLFKGGPAPVCGCASDPSLAGCCGGSVPSFPKIAGVAQMGLVTSEKTIDVNADLPTKVAGVQLEFSYNPKQIQSIVPELTDRTENMSLFFGVENGILRVGILDMTGENLIPSGIGDLVKLNITGPDVSSLEIQKAILVNENANPFEVNILPKEENQASTPKEFELSQNIPNPFNPETEVSYTLPHDSHVRLVVYNVAGQKVRTLVDRFETTGYRTVKWDGTDDSGSKVSSGIYFYHITAGDYSQSKKMVLMK